MIDVEALKTFGYIFFYPLMVATMTIKIAKWHFEKDNKTKYLHAKDQVANDLVNAITKILTAMWDLSHTQQHITEGRAEGTNQNVVNFTQTALQNIKQATMESYTHLGRAGLYCGSELVEKVSMLQSDLNRMVSENNFEVFNMDNWDEYRRGKILPVLQAIHDDLKNTVFDRIKSFRLYM